MIVAGFPCPSVLPHTHVRMCNTSLDLEVINKEKEDGQLRGNCVRRHRIGVAGR